MNLKYTEDADGIRITFRWPQDAPQAYVFKADGEIDINTADISRARLFTQQEYKRLGGFTDRKTPGTHTYHFYPFVRENGRDRFVPAENNKITCVTGLAPVEFMIKEKTSLISGEKTHIITLACAQAVAAGALCYTIKGGSYPQDMKDGTVYFFGEALKPGVEMTSRVKTKKNEYLRIFIFDEQTQKQCYLHMVGMDG